MAKSTAAIKFKAKLSRPAAPKSAAWTFLENGTEVVNCPRARFQPVSAARVFASSWRAQRLLQKGPLSVFRPGFEQLKQPWALNQPATRSGASKR